MSVNYAEARQKMQELRSYYGKLKNEIITIDEFCAYTGYKKSYVRMHVVSRKVENEMIKNLNNQSVTMELEVRNW